MLFVIFPLLLSIIFLSLIFSNFITMCLSVFILYGALCISWTWVAISFPMLGKFSSIISSNIFLGPLFLSCPSGNPIMQMLVCIMLSQRSLRLSSFLFVLFSLFCYAAVNSTIQSSRSLIHSSASVILLWFLLVYFSFQLFYCSSLFVL